MENLKKLEEQAKVLEGIDPTKLDEKQLTQLAEQLSFMFKDSELLLNSISEKLQQEEQENENDDN
jgi:hypothetical protein